MKGDNMIKIFKSGVIYLSNTWADILKAIIDMLIKKK